jgi:hypothetical protein
MNKHTYLIVVGLIAIVLLILTNLISENYIFNMKSQILLDIVYVLLTGGISYFLHAKFIKK